MNNFLNSFQKAYQQLNPEQKLAVDTIDGPLLVLAGPGTGKTQLLSARVANILQKTDVSPGNILCLTFTESGATNMRSRLREFIGDAAYEVTISTYHSFGSDIIKSYGEYFQQIRIDRSDDVRLERPIDELSQLKVVEKIVNNLSYDNSLLSARYYLKDLVATLSDLKQHLISPSELKEIGISNLKQIDAAQLTLDELVNDRGGISRKKAELIHQYYNLFERLSRLKGSLIEKAVLDLQNAITEFEELNSSVPLTNWKNAWLFKNNQDRFTLTNRASSSKLLDLASVYATYEQALKTDALYDFNDMILRTIDCLKMNDELRFNLQERYQYILLDEFQDTNPSQFELVKRIADHPVHEGRPNIMVVGDDDQAIFAFQGANVGNIQDFLDSFRDVKVINLSHNYRSHRNILHIAQNISSQIKGRLGSNRQEINKLLIAKNSSLPASSTIVRSELAGAADEYAWVSQQIASLISGGTDPKEIVVIAPKHKILEGLVPFLTKLSIPITYEKRENILDSEIIKILHNSAQLLASLSSQNQAKVNELFPQVLSHAYWGLPTLEIWRTNWQFAKNDETRSWAEIALENTALSEAVAFYLELSREASSQPLESILDQLMDRTPLKSYYFAKELRSSRAVNYYDAITYLSTIRTHLRDHQSSSNKSLILSDFLDFIAMYNSAGEGLLNTHSITQGNNSVQLMTAYKVKGLEFDHVFILQAHNDIWGSASRGRGNNLVLPPNLSHIRYTPSGDDERLRLFFVAITRARHGLYISSHTTQSNGKPTTPLKYLGEVGGISPHLPTTAQKIITTTTNSSELAENIATLWSAGRVTLPADFRDLLKDHLDRYLMSPTHLNTFMDLEHGGPEEFLVRTLLRFPSAKEIDSEYGQTIHNTLEWYQHQLVSGKRPTVNDAISYYKTELNRRYLSDHDLVNLQSRGEVVLRNYLTSRTEMFKSLSQAEVNFFGEGVVIDEARLTGKIDRLEIDHAHKTLRIVDFKTGTPLTKWGQTMKAYKYRHQLYFYKFLIEGSRSWRDYKVIEARLEFVEPADLKNETIAPPLTIQFDQVEEQKIKRLINIVWSKINTLDLPQTDQYAHNLQGTISFERDLLA